mmetsp:Transcript_93460/g.267435  ORF Transcript_93460/g.267435 Transcript_93460/m.267435 type:complete len:304 (-) Transcript_93460:156-1067(-)
MLGDTFAVLAVMERFDESLALLSHTLCWPLEELAYLKVNEHKSSYARPEPAAVTELQKILSIDLQLYNFATSELDRKLKKMTNEGKDVSAMIAELNEGTTALVKDCTGNCHVSARCWRSCANQREYTQHLKAMRGVMCSAQKYDTVVVEQLPPEIREPSWQCSNMTMKEYRRIQTRISRTALEGQPVNGPPPGVDDLLDTTIGVRANRSHFGGPPVAGGSRSRRGGRQGGPVGPRPGMRHPRRPGLDGASGPDNGSGGAGADGPGPGHVASLVEEQKRLQTQLRANYIKLQAANAASGLPGFG